MRTGRNTEESMRNTNHTKQIQLNGQARRIIEIGRDSTSVFAGDESYQLYIYHILVDSEDDLYSGFENGHIKIDVGNGYQKFPVDRILLIEDYPLMIEGRRTSITEWVLAVGERELAERAVWEDLPREIEQELEYRCRPSSYIDSQ
jgi:hypothetical protein